MPPVMTVTWLDSEGKTAQSVMELTVGTVALSVGDETALNNVLLNADELSDAMIKEVNISFRHTLPAALKNAPVDGKDVGDKRLYIQHGNNATLDYIASTSIPAYNEVGQIPETDVVSPTAVEIAALSNAIIAAPIVTHANFPLTTFGRVWTAR